MGNTGVAGNVRGGGASGGNTTTTTNFQGNDGADGIVVLTWEDVVSDLSRDIPAESLTLDDVGQGTAQILSVVHITEQLTVTLDLAVEVIGDGLHVDDEDPLAILEDEGGDDLAHEVDQEEWHLSDTDLTVVLDRAPTEREHARYWVEVIDAARSVIRSGDPDLIYPGEEIPLPPTLDAGVRP